MPGTDPRQSGPCHVGTPVIADKQNFLRLQTRIVQKTAEQRAAALLHSVRARNKTAVQHIISTAPQHGRHLLGRQIHIRNIIKFLSLRMQGADCLPDRQVGDHGCQFLRALLRRIISRHTGTGVDLCQCDFPLRFRAGLHLRLPARVRKRPAAQKEQVGGAAHIPFEQRVEYIQRHRTIGRRFT